jgi:hypothetical protein
MGLRKASITLSQIQAKLSEFLFDNDFIVIMDSGIPLISYKDANGDRFEVEIQAVDAIALQCEEDEEEEFDEESDDEDDWFDDEEGDAGK